MGKFHENKEQIRPWRLCMNSQLSRDTGSGGIQFSKDDLWYSEEDFLALQRERDELEKDAKAWRYYKELLQANGTSITELLVERDQAWNAAIEEAAKLCDVNAYADYSNNTAWLAIEIRKLKRPA